MTQILPYTYTELLRRLRNACYLCTDCMHPLYESDYNVDRQNRNDEGPNHIKTSDWDGAYWVTAKCPECQYDWAIWKLIKTNGVIPKEEREKYFDKPEWSLSSLLNN